MLAHKLPLHPNHPKERSLEAGGRHTASDHKVIIVVAGDEDRRIYYMYIFSVFHKQCLERARIASFYASLSHKDELPVALYVAVLWGIVCHAMVSSLPPYKAMAS